MKMKTGILISMLLASATAQAQPATLGDLCQASRQINQAFSAFFALSETGAPSLEAIQLGLQDLTFAVGQSLGRYEVSEGMLGRAGVPDPSISRTFESIKGLNGTLSSFAYSEDAFNAIHHSRFVVGQIQRQNVNLLGRTCGS